jgi:protein involved in polysaccharide export with SLBB domain
MNKIKSFLLLVFFSFSVLSSYAQVPVAVNVDQLTDQQLLQFIQNSNLAGLSESELELKAKEKGLSAEQIEKIKLRVQSLNIASGKVNGSDSKNSETAKRSPITTISPKSEPDVINGLVIYGSEIFTRQNLTFEPNMNIPTPKNYVLGTGDELKIDIYGFSEKSQSLKVSPDGFIRYPNIGPIKIAGLNIDEAKVKLTSVLGKLYPGLSSGTTSLQLSLGQIRSIHVNLIGEISKPGQYTISSLSTIANALYAAGGPTKIGSYRNIDLVRNGKTIAKFDLYDYLLKGDLSSNKMLQDEDVIVVSPYKKRVEVNGGVKRVGIYEVSTNDKLSDLINYVGGLTDNANKLFVRVVRYGKQDNEIYTVGYQELNGFELQSGDKITVDLIGANFKNRITINGAVYYSGVYSLEKVVTLKDLISISKPMEEAYKKRAILRRLQNDFTPEILSFDLDEVNNGTFNIDLKREDSIYIYKNSELKEMPSIQIRGDINKPSSYFFAKGLKLEDAILIAGGFKEGASKKFIEVARRIKDTAATNSNPSYANVYTLDLSSYNKQGLQFDLEPFDIITIHKSPGYKEQISINIEGEVMFPGSYAISNSGERLSDILTRAGGMKSGGYAEGAYVLRRTFENPISSDDVLLKNKTSNLKNANFDSSKMSQIDVAFKENYKVLGIRLDEVLKNKGSIYDVILEDGDIIKIPKYVESIQTFSGVYFPKKIVYRNGLTVSQVLRESGGVIPNGLKRRSYVVYPNGEVKSTKKILFFRTYPKLKPGSEVYVPIKKESKQLSTVEIMAITTGIATLATVIFSAISLTR